MVDTRSLALDQTPPIHVPFRFFLVAPLFVAAAGLLLAFDGPALFQSRWNPDTLVLTHLVTLGFLSQAMMGATMQLLPVLAGVSVWRASFVSKLVQVLLVTGTVALTVGFHTGLPSWLLAGGSLSASSFVLFLAVTGIALLHARGLGGTLTTLRLGWAALLATAGLGLLLVLVLADRMSLDAFQIHVDLHLAWGLLGWAGLNLIAFAFELIPMFYMAPRSRSRVLPMLALAVFGSLVGLSISVRLGTEAAGRVLVISALAALSAAALMVLRATLRRKRPVVDTTLLYVWAGFGSIVAAVGAWIVTSDPILVGVLLLVGAAVALPSAMLYKIVPFLCWLHLQRAQVAGGGIDRPVPPTKVFIPERQARRQLYLFLAAFGALLLGHGWLDPLIRLGGGLLALSSLFLFGNLLSAMRRYRGERIAIEQS